MNFNSLNKIFEDKFTISKKLLREEASLKSKKEKSKKKLTESIDKNLTERDWKLTIPGSFRDDMLNAGEEEDFDKVKNILIDMCNYVLEHIDESNFDLDDQEYVIEEFEDFIEELEYVDFEDEDEANYYLNDLYDLLDNTDIFLGLRESLNEEKITSGNMEQEDINIIQPLIDDFDSLEDANKDVLSITWNFGRRNSDNKMTAGVDIYFLAKGSEENLQPYLKQVEDIILSDGYKFDDSLGYDLDPWKEHAFGNGYHTQIIEDIERPLDEEIHPNLAMVQDRYTAAAEKGLEEQAREILSDNLIAVKEGQCIETSVNSNTKAAYFALRRLLKESLSESSEKDLESGYYPDEWDIDFEDELENLGIEPQRGVYIGYQYRVPNRRFASKMVRLAKEFGYDDSWVEGNILYLKWSRPEKEYHKSLYDESLNESWVLFFDEDGINHAGSDGAHKFNLSPKIIERKIKSSDYHLPNWAESYIILSDSEFHKMDYDEIEKYHKRYGKTLNEDTVKQDGKWVNKGKEGTHGKFKTKKEADAQRRAMFANGYKESLKEAHPDIMSFEEWVRIRKHKDVDDLSDEEYYKLEDKYDEWVDGIRSSNIPDMKGTWMPESLNKKRNLRDK